jgi:hypothetical protein
MATISIDDDTLRIELRALEALWSFHGSFSIPLANVTRATTGVPPGLFEAVRLIGTGAWPLKTAGTFLYHGEIVFCDYGGGDDVLVIDLVENAYRHLFVSVAAPDTPQLAAARIMAALVRPPGYTEPTSPG